MMEEVNKKTGIIGGTFNPIHLGHLLLAQTAKDHFGLDHVLFIPSGCSYMKKTNEVAAKEMRLQMTTLAVSNNPDFYVSAMEVEREGNSYTCDTLAELKRQEPEDELYFIVGADSLFTIETWKNPDVIFGLCTVLAAVRGDKDKKLLEQQADYLKEKYHAQIQMLAMEEIAISSTEIRNRVEQRKSIRDMVPDQVADFIMIHDLYGKMSGLGEHEVRTNPQASRGKR